jgi:hypothetical protein
MCIACEMAYWTAMEDLPPSTGMASHVDTRADDVPRFVCEAPAPSQPSAPPAPDERKPIVKNRE